MADRNPNKPGEVGRPDLAISWSEHTNEALTVRYRLLIS
jgi:hypothetical protein